MPLAPSPSFTPEFYTQIQAGVKRKYDILAEHAAADTLRAQTDASTLPGLREAQAFNLRGGGQLDVERAATERYDRMNPDRLRAAHYYLDQNGGNPQYRPPPQGAPPAAVAPAAPPPWATLPSLQEQYRQLSPITAPPPAAAPPPIVQQQSIESTLPARPSYARSNQAATQLPLTSLLRPGGANPNFSPLSAPLSTLRTNLSDTDTDTTTPSQRFQNGTANVVPLRRGSANVKGKGGKSKGSKGSGQPAGLEAILPALMAAAQGGGVGAGAGAGAAGPQPPGGPDTMAPPMASGAAAPPGFVQGVSNVRGYADGSEDTGGGGSMPVIQAGGGGMLSMFGGMPAMRSMPAMRDMPTMRGMPGMSGLPGMPARPSIFGGGRGSWTPGNPDGGVGGGGGDGSPRGGPTGVVPPPIPTPGVAPVTGAPNFDPVTGAPATGLRRGTPNVPPNPGYPFGAGYMFGATAVPGQGSGTVDKVPAVLAPHEAVLNKAAADNLGRNRIAALNAQGVRQMQLGRGVR